MVENDFAVMCIWISRIKREFSRLAKFEKTEFTLVNEYFENECNAENTFLYGL